MNEILNQWLAQGALFMLATLFGLAMIATMIVSAIELLWKWCRKKLGEWRAAKGMPGRDLGDYL